MNNSMSHHYGKKIGGTINCVRFVAVGNRKEEQGKQFLITLVKYE